MAMKRSDFIIKLISGLLFAALVLYIGYYFYNSSKSSLKTVLASVYTVEDGIRVDGYFVKNEKLLSGDGGYIALTAEEGDKLAAGDAYATEYTSADALERASLIKSTKLEIQQTESLMSSSVSKDRANDSILDLAYAVNSGDFSSLDESSIGVKTYILGGGTEYGDEQLSQQLSELQDSLAALEAEENSDSAAKAIVAEETGTFSSIVDGFEGVSPDMISDITPDRLKELFKEGESRDPVTLGKLVTGVEWYFAAIMDAEDAADFKIGESETISFASIFDEPVKMKVENIGPEADGQQVVVFSCSKYFFKAAAARNTDGTIVRESYSGIRVPKEAMHLDEDGNTFVYVVTGIRVGVKQVEILGELDDCYIVSDNKSSELRAGDEIIVTSKEIYEGKVIS